MPVANPPSTGWNVAELRQYTLHPGRRDELIELFDRHFVESQEEVGIRVLGQFLDLDDPDRFVWLRSFPDMPSRAASLSAFYERHPAWREHRDAANATMIDSDDVLLLKPVEGGNGFPEPSSTRPAVGVSSPASSLFQATIYHLDTPMDRWFTDFFEQRVQPVVREAGAEPLACLQTEPAENTFPKLPVRTGENVFVWFASFANADQYQAHLERLTGSSVWRDGVLPELTARLARAPERLRLAPTSRSLLR